MYFRNLKAEQRAKITVRTYMNCDSKTEDMSALFESWFFNGLDQAAKDEALYEEFEKIVHDEKADYAAQVFATDHNG